MSVTRALLFMGLVLSGLLTCCFSVTETQEKLVSTDGKDLEASSSGLASQDYAGLASAGKGLGGYGGLVGKGFGGLGGLGGLGGVGGLGGISGLGGVGGLGGLGGVGGLGGLGGLYGGSPLSALMLSGLLGNVGLYGAGLYNSPYLGLLLSQYSRYLPFGLGAYGLYGYSATNNLQNNRPYGSYKYEDRN